MSVPAKGFRYARTGSIAEVLKPDTFNATLRKVEKEVMIKMSHAPVHRTDAAIINGTALGAMDDTAAPAGITNFGKSIDGSPRIAGLEGIGTIVDAAKSTRFKAGDVVYVAPTAGCGTWASHVVADSDHVFTVPAVAHANLNLAANAMNLVMAHHFVNAGPSVYGTKPSKDDSLYVQNGGSSLTSLAITQFAKNKGIPTLTCVSDADKAHFEAAKKRHEALGGKVFPYSVAGIRSVSAEANKHKAKGATRFFNGVGGRLTNEMLKTLANGGYAITYGAQSGYGFMFAGSQHIYRDITHCGFYFPRYWTQSPNLLNSIEQRQEKLNEVLSEVMQDGKTVPLAAYPFEVIGAEKFETAWDSMYVSGGKKCILSAV